MLTLKLLCSTEAASSILLIKPSLIADKASVLALGSSTFTNLIAYLKRKEFANFFHLSTLPLYIKSPSKGIELSNCAAASFNSLKKSL